MQHLSSPSYYIIRSTISRERTRCVTKPPLLCTLFQILFCAYRKLEIILNFTLFLDIRVNDKFVIGIHLVFS